MSVQVIQQRLQNYHCQNTMEEQHAIREITQEVVLAALGRSDFFKHALFQGGTCLRIFHGLNRFSEDLDFILRKPNNNFKLTKYLLDLSTELTVYGYQFEITDRNSVDKTIKKAFLKDRSLGKIIELHHTEQYSNMAKLRIKLEVDTNPPDGSGEVLEYLDFPFVSSVSAQDKPSLFAGKIHALLCRQYLKGRDWYDFIWYTSNGIAINYHFLRSAINQFGPWQGSQITVDRSWLIEQLQKKITSLNWQQATEDVRRFINIHEQPSLDLWSKELFLAQLKKIK
jgi:predicted nucleotidyltransferase component of viral defense system